MWVGGLAGVFALTSWAASTNESFAGVGEVRAAVWTILPSENSSDTRFSIDCSGFSAVPVEGGYSLRIPGQVSSEARTPDVPRLAKLFPGVKRARAVLTVEGSDPTNIACTVAAAEGYRLDDPESPNRKLRPYRQPDPEIYANDRFWPSDLGRLAQATIGTQKVVRVECFPVQYDPITREVRFYRRLEGFLRFEPIENISSP